MARESGKNRHFADLRIKRVKAQELAPRSKDKVKRKQAELQLALGEFVMSQLPDDFLENYGEIADDIRKD